MKTILAILILFAHSLTAAVLAWNPSTTSGVTYFLYGGKNTSFVNDLVNAPIRQSCGTNLQTLITTDGSLWWFVVTAKNGLGQESDVSNMVPVGTNAAPPTGISPPTNLRVASPSRRKAVLTWTQSLSTSVVQYKAFSGDAPGGYSKGYFTGGNTSSYTITGLQRGWTYWFTVRALSASGESPNSNEVSCKIR